MTLPHTAADAFLQAMENNPLVDRVEVDQPFTLSQTTQTSAIWGLDRSDQRDLPLSGSYTYTASGSAVRAYVVDTGILAEHADFGGRVSGGYTSIADGYGTRDCNGHGTDVAGTIGAATWGIAKAVALVPVRVASPHAAGLAAQILQSSPSPTPTQLADAIKAAATTGKVTSAGTGSPNLLLFTGASTNTEEPPPASTVVSVSALTGSGQLVRNGWRATVGITVKDASGVAVGGAVVTGNFTVGGSGLKCTTSTAGVCSVTSGQLSKSTTQTSFSVNGITGTHMTYDSANNEVSTIVVQRP